MVPIYRVPIPLNRIADFDLVGTRKRKREMKREMKRKSTGTEMLQYDARCSISVPVLFLFISLFISLLLFRVPTKSKSAILPDATFYQSKTKKTYQSRNKTTSPDEKKTFHQCFMSPVWTGKPQALLRCPKIDFSETDHGAGEGGPRCGKLAKNRKNWILASKCSVEEHICAHMGCGVRIGRPKSSFLK